MSLTHDTISPSQRPSTSHTGLLICGVVIFALARLLWVAVPPIALNIPRLGDDALVYLWKGALAREWYGTDAPAIGDVLTQGNLNDDPPWPVQQARSRVLGRVVGTYGPVYDLLPRAALSFGLQSKWAFALTEVLGVVVMTAGAAAFLSVLVGKAAAGVGLVLMAFAILPAQGIGSFIPSTLALALSMLLWATVLFAGEAAPLLPVVGAATAILGIHPVGQIYVLMAVPMHMIGLGGFRSRWRGRTILLYAGLILMVTIAALIPYFVQGLSILGAGDRGGVSLAAGFWANLQAAWSAFKDPFIRKNALLVILIGWSAVWGRQEVFHGKAPAVLGSILGFMLLSLFHTLPGYPGELFSRLFVPAVVVAAGLAGRCVVLCAAGARRRHLLIIGGLVGLGVTGMLWVNEWFHVLNSRPEVVQENHVRRELAGLPKDTTILYGEADISLMVSLLNGGQRFGALAYPMLAGTPSLGGLIQAKKPRVILLQGLRSLNTLAVQRVKSFTARRLGFFFPVTDRVTLRCPPGEVFSGLHVYVTNGGQRLILRASTDESRLGGGKVAADIPVPEWFEGWLSVWDRRMQEAEEITLILPDTWGWIEGITTVSPEPHVRWPWKSGIHIAYHVRGKPPEKGGALEFTVDRLLKDNGLSALRTLVSTDAPVVSDDSGLIFLRTVFAGGGG